MWFDIAGACATLTLMLAATAVGTFWRITRQPQSSREGLDEVPAPAEMAAVAI